MKTQVGKLAFHYKHGLTGTFEFNKKRFKEWYENNKEHRQEYVCLYNKKYLSRKKELRKLNPLREKHYAHRRRELASQLTFQIVQMVYEDNIKRYGTLTCYLCLKSIEFGKDCLEHKIPICRGGTNEYENLAVAHRVCNLVKGRKTYKEYICLTI